MPPHVPHAARAGAGRGENLVGFKQVRVTRHETALRAVAHMQTLQGFPVMEHGARQGGVAVDQYAPVRIHQGNIGYARLSGHFLHQIQHGILPHVAERTGAALQSPDQHIGPALHIFQHLALFLPGPARNHDGRDANARQGQPGQRLPEKTCMPPLFPVSKRRIVLPHILPRSRVCNLFTRQRVKRLRLSRATGNSSN